MTVSEEGSQVWSAIVIDDERLAQRRVEALLARDPEIHVAGTTADPEEALALIRTRMPDLIFLDIQMPQLNGIDLVRRLAPDAVPLVVFVTAYDEYAVRAFDLHAVDYVLKPVDSERFGVALLRAKQRLHSETRERRADAVQRLLSSQAGPAKLDRIAVHARGRMRLLRLDEVKWFQAANNYVQVRAAASEYLLRETIASLESKLDHRQFVRIHRSTIVNIDHVLEFVPRAFGDYVVRLRGGGELLMSRRFRKRVEPFIGHF